MLRKISFSLILFGLSFTVNLGTTIISPRKTSPYGVQFLPFHENFVWEPSVFLHRSLDLTSR